MGKIKVFIVEDDLDWLKELIKFLYDEEDILIVGTATTKEEAVELARSIQLDVVLMDINLSGNELDGIYATLEITEICDAKIIMLTSFRDEELIEQAFTAGAANYVAKSKYKLIPDMIREVYMETTPVEILAKKFRAYKKEEQLKCLTPAEKEIFHLVEQGYTRAQIKSKLSKTENTVKNQIKNIRKKLGGTTLKEALAKVENRGLSSANMVRNKRKTNTN